MVSLASKVGIFITFEFLYQMEHFYDLGFRPIRQLPEELVWLHGIGICSKYAVCLICMQSGCGVNLNSMHPKLYNQHRECNGIFHITKRQPKFSENFSSMWILFVLALVSLALVRMTIPIKHIRYLEKICADNYGFNVF